MRGGPAAISAALVPGCILLLAFASIVLCSIVGSRLDKLRDGDWGPICISVGGGGLGEPWESLVVEPWWARFQVVALLQLQVVKKHVSDSVDL